jgi:hypothetical protein
LSNDNFNSIVVLYTKAIGNPMGQRATQNKLFEH